MNRNGNWELYSILVYNVYYDDRLSVYDENDPDLYANGHEFIISQHQQESVETKVVSTVFITVNSPTITDEENNNLTTKFENFNILGAKLNAANTGVEKTALFMDSYTISGLSYTVNDFENMAVIADTTTVSSGGFLKEIVLNYDYGKDSSSLGSYVREDNGEIDPNLKIKLTAISEGSTTYKQSAYTSEGSSAYVEDEQVTIYYAGSYTPALEFDVDNKTSTVSFDYSCDTNKRASSPTVINAALPAFKVYSIPPSVGVPTTGNNEAAYSNYENYASNASTVAVSADKKITATLYFRETEENACGIKYNNYRPPYLYLSIENLGKATTAVLEFSSDLATVHVYNKEDEPSQTSHYSWSSNGSCKRWIGFWESKTGSDDKEVAGVLTASKLILTCNGIQYSLAVPNITINNPN